MQDLHWVEAKVGSIKVRCDNLNRLQRCRGHENECAVKMMRWRAIAES